MMHFTDVFHSSEIGDAWLHPSFSGYEGKVQTIYVKQGLIVIVTPDKVGVYQLAEDNESYVLTDEVDL